MSNKPARVGRRITSHPLATPEKLAELDQVSEQAEAYFQSAEGKEYLRRSLEEAEGKRQHGGSRPGAGRPKSGGRKPTVSFAVTDETKQFLQSQENTSAYLEALIRRSGAFRQWQKGQNSH
jgi:hypothetical protein